MKHQGLVIIYIGNGKGKTTAAVGLAARAAGAGKKVLFVQFVKSAKAKAPGEWPQSSEIAALKQLSRVKVKIFGKGFVGILGDNKLHRSHVSAAERGLEWIQAEIQKNKYQTVIADEIVSAIELKLLTVDQVRALFRLRDSFEVLVMTGHKKYNKLISSADLVTEMKMVKHPYYKGLIAQRGVDY
ncbi:MAG: cob(I)yrinic acid a,c-diamide adenosyltransferase [Patescibacteria group bacterium]|nr:cob(I)yrinic acid a,c-diamide adenosyltransferase [Patescibacteria group bacterium]